MINIYEQLQIIFYYVLLGMFIASTFDILKLLTNNSKLYIKYISQAIYWVSLIYISTLYIIKYTSHYLTLYTILFFIIGIYLYYILLSNSNNNNILYIKPYLKKILILLYTWLLPIDLLKYVKYKVKTLLLKIKKRKTKNLPTKDTDITNDIYNKQNKGAE